MKVTVPVRRGSRRGHVQMEELEAPASPMVTIPRAHLEAYEAAARALRITYEGGKRLTDTAFVVKEALAALRAASLLDQQAREQVQNQKLFNRIRELEAERDALKEERDRFLRVGKEQILRADAIKAKTIEECAQLAENEGGDEYGPPPVVTRIAREIRALSQPAEAGKE